MPTTAQEVFTQMVLALSPIERLRLAALILDDLTHSNPSVVAHDDTWSEQDQHDITAFSLQYATTLYPEDEELV
ncbi:hypothetical protein SD81_020170 [Tolypothrix campylonemoides VB511288]|nr:hypothetical protein SD81_020170 [Tolypothrix campylonemoides VB511288]